MQSKAICFGPVDASHFTERVRHHDGRGTKTVVPIEWHEKDAEPVRVAVVQINPKTKLEEPGNS
jgi:hypothetical protein